MTAESQNSGSHEAATVTKTEGEERGGGPMREEEGGRESEHAAAGLTTPPCSCPPRDHTHTHRSVAVTCPSRARTASPARPATRSSAFCPAGP